MRLMVDRKTQFVAEPHNIRSVCIRSVCHARSVSSMCPVTADGRTKTLCSLCVQACLPGFVQNIGSCDKSLYDNQFRLKYRTLPNRVAEGNIVFGQSDHGLPRSVRRQFRNTINPFNRLCICGSAFLTIGARSFGSAWRAAPATDLQTVAAHSSTGVLAPPETKKRNVISRCHP